MKYFAGKASYLKSVFLVMLLFSCADFETTQVQKLDFEEILDFDFIRDFIKDDRFSIERAYFSDLPNWHTDHHLKAIESFANSCKKIQQINPDSFISSDFVSVRTSYMKDACSKLVQYYPVRSKEFFEENFYPFKVTKAEDAGKFTGYYVPLLKGSRKFSDKYYYPIYSVPDDYVKGQKYLSRFDIENGELTGKGLEILYLDSHIDGFFLHVQGSGYVELDTGETVLVSFAAKNNQPYTAIGKILIEENFLKKQEVSMQSIKAWLETNPNLAKQIMNMNDSFIFFKESPLNYVIGAGGVELIARRSLAVDKDYIPLHLPVYVSIPNQMHNLMMAQDVGSAIKGAIRGDIFFGIGDEAGEIAGKFNEPGSYYLFIPKLAVDKKNAG